MTCKERIAEVVECARRSRGNGKSTDLDWQLQSHLSHCARCRERWDAERQLTLQLDAIRGRAESIRGAALRLRDSRRQDLMRDFSRIHRRHAVPSWAWALSAAAALLLAVFLGHMWGLAAKKPAHEFRKEQAVLYTASVALSNDAGVLSSDDFIAVPYTPPLAPGEMVRVLRADLYPEALASMGVAVDPSWPDRLQADVVVGEDGLPRAVRITDDGQY